MNESRPRRGAAAAFLITALLVAGCGDPTTPPAPRQGQSTAETPPAPGQGQSTADPSADLEAAVSSAEAELNALDQDFRSDDTP